MNETMTTELQISYKCPQQAPGKNDMVIFKVCIEPLIVMPWVADVLEASGVLARTVHADDAGIGDRSN